MTRMLICANHFSRACGRAQIRDTMPNISALSEWSGLDLRHLAALEAIAREGSVSRAAAQLGYTQSAVSQQLQALERIVGVTLVTRSPGVRSIELTEAGRQLLAHADAIAGHLETARADLAAFSDGRTGELRIGAVPSAAAALVPALAEDLRARAPRLRAARERVLRSRRAARQPRRGRARPGHRAGGRAARRARVRGDHARPLRPARAGRRPARAPRPPRDAGRPRRARPDRQGLRHRQPARPQRCARRLRPAPSRASARTTCARCRRSCAAASASRSCRCCCSTSPTRRSRGSRSTTSCPTAGSR